MKTKRFLSIALALCMMLSLLPADVLAVEWPQADTRAQVPQRGSDAPSLVDGYYEIYNADQLYWFAEQVNGGSTSINGKLMTDIVVNENVLKADGTLNGDGSNFRVWTPIGNSSKKYSGTFDGNGKTVSDLYFNDTSKWHIGLFGGVDDGGAVKNVGVIGSYLRGDRYVGGVVGCNDGTVDNCYNTGTVNGSYYGEYSDSLWIGGVVGYNTGTVSNCYNSGSVSGCDEVGGVVGGNCGIVSNCYNTGSVSGYSSFSVSRDIGGVVGQNDGTVSNSYNTGSVSGIDLPVGGVVGDNDGTVSNCYNTGSVSGSEKVGGVVGSNNGYSTVSNSHNTGSVSGSKYVGGVVGINSGTVSNCYYLTGCAKDGNSKIQYGIGNSTKGSSTADVAGNTTEKTAAQFVSGEVAYLLNMKGGVRNWGQKLTVERYPVISQDRVYMDGEGYSNCPGHVYANGFCIICNDYESAVLNVDVYEISNVGQLYWFANSVNVSDASINGKLMVDIVVNENVLTADGKLNGDGSNFRILTPIGVDYRISYKGTFDGNDRTVSGLYFNDTSKSYVGLFGYVGSGGVIKNVGVVGSYLRGKNYVGGVVGHNSGIVSNSYNIGNVSGSKYVGGVVGYIGSAVVSNSYNTGSVSGSTGVGGVAGDMYIHDCLDMIECDCRETDSGWVDNCYYLVDCVLNGNSYGSAKSAAQFASGEVAYLLQVEQTEHIWGQKIGTDPYPILGGEKVYFANGTYSNSDVPTLNNGYYEIYTADQLYWFAEKVNGGSTSINGKLMADIVVNENVLNADGTLNGTGSNFRVWTPIGYYYAENSCKKYTGIFDGNGKTISGLYYNSTSKDYLGLFGYVYKGGSIKNVGIIDSYLKGCCYVGGVVGYGYNTSVSGCYNSGSVMGGMYVGGVVGQNEGYDSKVTNCYNTGRVISGFYDFYTGGVVGQIEYGDVLNCYNIGIVKGDYNVGGVVGGEDYGTISNCYYLSGCVTDGNSYGTKKTAEQFASGEVAYLLQFRQTAYIWGQTIGTDAYPTLGGETVYKNQTGGCNRNSYTYEYSNTKATAVTTHVWNAATCTEPQTCADCGLTEGNALGHSWTEATCTTPETCTVCGGTTGNPLGHRWTAATCNEPKTCTVCGVTTGTALGHSWKSATCTAPKTCIRCDLTEGSALGHNWSDATCTKPSTCTACGATTGNALGHIWADATCTKPSTCTVCGGTSGSALGHSWSNATCTTAKTCTTCGEITGNALGHNWKNATCTEPKTCIRCGLTEGNPLGHNWAEATCTKPSTCTTCGATTGNALGHQWEDATCTTAKTCTVCGTTSGNPLGHKWAAATCTTPKTCTVCKATSGSVLGHKWSNATCTDAKTCSACGATEGSALGHNWAEATCTKPKTCTRCGETMGTALNHIEVAVPGYAATYDEPGLTDGAYCQRCSQVLVEQTVIAPLSEEISFSYKAYGNNGSTNAVNSGNVTLEIWMNVETDIARAWGADVQVLFNENLTLLSVEGGIFQHSLATPLNIANERSIVKLTQDMGYSGDKIFKQGKYLFATLNFKVAKEFKNQNISFNINLDQCHIARGEFANQLNADFGDGAQIYVSMLGDATQDGRITSSDTMALSRWLAGADLDAYKIIYDLNKDGYVDGDDFALLRGAVVLDDSYLDI